MLTFKNIKGSRLIAQVVGGKYDGKQIRLITEDIDKNNNDNMIDIKHDPLDYITEDHLRSFKKKLSPVDLAKLKKALTINKEPFEDYLIEIYNSVKGTLKHKKITEFVINDGEIIPFCDEKKTQRMYVAGPSDSGKSVWTSKYALTYKQTYPNHEIYIFSDVEEDQALDKLDPTRIRLNEQLVQNPIHPESLKNSLVIFDDIDSIIDKSIKNSVGDLRDSLLKRGRHENITVVCTSHQITNYKDSRVILNEANAITVFPKSGSTHGIIYVLKKYCGLSAQCIDRIMSLPSRWVSVYKNYPMYVIYQSGVFLL